MSLDPAVIFVNHRPQATGSIGSCQSNAAGAGMDVDGRRDHGERRTPGRHSPTSENVTLVQGDRRRVARLSILGTAPYRLRLEGMGRLWEAQGDELFSALVKLRSQLDVDGWLISVAGAHRDAYPSADGEGVVTDGTGRSPLHSDAVDVLQPVEDVQMLTTVDQQQGARPTITRA